MSKDKYPQKQFDDKTDIVDVQDFIFDENGNLSELAVNLLVIFGLNYALKIFEIIVDKLEDLKDE